MEDKELTNDEKYELLTAGEVGLPSTMGILPNSESFTFDAKMMESALKSAKDFKLISFEEGEAVDEVLTACEAEVEYKDTIYELSLYVCPVKGLDLRNFGFANRVTEAEMEAATKPHSYLEVQMYFSDEPLTSFHLQLKVLHAIVAEASIVVDFSSLRLLSPSWLKMTSESAIPPSPDYLYTVHSIYDEKENGETVYWLHTHGLHRCGIVELEILNIKQGAQEMYSLLNMTVKKFLDSLPKERERTTIGYDGMGLDLCWLRWEEALSDIPKDALGGMNSRLDEEGHFDQVHTEPSGILFAVEDDNNMISPQIYIKTIADNPIFYITNEETKRMSDLAVERFPLFKKAFELYAPKAEKKSFLKKLFSKKEEEENQWSFIAKIGLPTDDSEDGTDKEHLWFTVLDISSDNKITGELQNAPYWIADLKLGDVNTYPLETLTDWVIYAPDTSYDTDTIYQLELDK